MATQSIFSCMAASLLLICFLLTHSFPSGDYCNSILGYGCFSRKPAAFQPLQSRKMLGALKEMQEKLLVEGGGKRGGAVNVGWDHDQLRRVPSGPDPLHHSGGSQKKPRTP